MSRAKAVFIPPAKLVVVARSSYPTEKTRTVQGSGLLERVMGIEPTSSAWKADILADVLYPQLQKELYHNFPQMSSMNLAAA